MTRGTAATKTLSREANACGTKYKPKYHVMTKDDQDMVRRVNFTPVGCHVLSGQAARVKAESAAESRRLLSKAGT